jgi:hypothetical protein
VNGAPGLPASAGCQKECESEELGLPWAGKAREAAEGNMGTGSWVARLKDGHTLILKP